MEMNITHGGKSSCLIILSIINRIKVICLVLILIRTKKTGVNELDYNGKKILEVVV